MLSRDFIQGFLTGHVSLSQNPVQAKSDFSAWLNKQTDAVLSSDSTSDVRQAMVDSLSSFTVAVPTPPAPTILV